MNLKGQAIKALRRNRAEHLHAGKRVPEGISDGLLGQKKTLGVECVPRGVSTRRADLTSQMRRSTRSVPHDRKAAQARLHARSDDFMLPDERAEIALKDVS